MCTPAIETVNHFMQFRSKFASSLVCRRTKLLQVAGSSSTNLHPSHLNYHTGPLPDIQPFFSNAFECLEMSKSLERVRVTVQVDRPHLTLQDFDNITAAVCGYLEIPQVALVYTGCSDDGDVICWTTSAGLLPYLKSVTPGVSSDVLMAEQNILGVAAGDQHYHCLNLKVCT